MVTPIIQQAKSADITIQTNMGTQRVQLFDTQNLHLDPNSEEFRVHLAGLLAMDFDNIEEVSIDLNLDGGRVVHFGSMTNPEIMENLPGAIALIANGALNISQPGAVFDVEKNKQIFEVFLGAVLENEDLLAHPTLEKIDEAVAFTSRFVAYHIVTELHGTGNEGLAAGILAKVVGIPDADAQELVDYWVQNLRNDSYATRFLNWLVGVDNSDKHKHVQGHRDLLNNFLEGLKDPSSVKEGWKDCGSLNFHFKTATRALAFISKHPELNLAMTRMLTNLKETIAENPELKGGFQEGWNDLKENYGSLGSCFQVMKNELDTYGDKEFVRAVELYSSDKAIVEPFLRGYSDVRDRLLDDEVVEQVGRIGTSLIDFGVEHAKEVHDRLVFGNDHPELKDMGVVLLNHVIEDEDVESFRGFIRSMDRLNTSDPEFISEMLDSGVEVLSRVDSDQMQSGVQLLSRHAWSAPISTFSRTLDRWTEDPEKAQALMGVCRDNMPLVKSVVGSLSEKREQETLGDFGATLRNISDVDGTVLPEIVDDVLGSAGEMDPKDMQKWVDRLAQRDMRPMAHWVSKHAHRISSDPVKVKKIVDVYRNSKRRFQAFKEKAPELSDRFLRAQADGDDHPGIYDEAQGAGKSVREKESDDHPVAPPPVVMPYVPFVLPPMVALREGTFSFPFTSTVFKPDPKMMRVFRSQMVAQNHLQFPLLLNPGFRRTVQD
jgi:hypothetical protein